MLLVYDTDDTRFSGDEGNNSDIDSGRNNVGSGDSRVAMN